MNCKFLSPCEESAKPSLLGVHLILLYFISISLLIPEIFVLFSGGWAVGVGRSPTFLFKSLDKNMVYNLGIYAYVYKRNPCRTKVFSVLKFGEVGGREKKNINHCR